MVSQVLRHRCPYDYLLSVSRVSFPLKSLSTCVFIECMERYLTISVIPTGVNGSIRVGNFEYRTWVEAGKWGAGVTPIGVRRLGWRLSGSAAAWLVPPGEWPVSNGPYCIRYYSNKINTHFQRHLRSHTHTELGLGLGLGLGLDSLARFFSHALPFFSPPSFHTLSLSPAFNSVWWSD